MSSSFYQQGLRFECTQCSNCCRHDSGYVFLSKADLGRLATILHLTEEELLLNYCKVVDLGLVKRVSLLEKRNNDCIFWQDGCSVYEGRPLQCRSYPFWLALLEESEWQAEKNRCPGIDNGSLITVTTIEGLLRQRELEPLIDLKQ